MTKVSLISSSAELRDRLRPLTGDTSFSPVNRSVGEPPEVVIMDCRVDADSKLALVAQMIETYPATGVLLVSDSPADLALAALRVGVQEILYPGSSMEEFGAAVESIAETTQNRVRQFSEVPTGVVPSERKGRVIS